MKFWLILCSYTAAEYKCWVLMKCLFIYFICFPEENNVWSRPQHLSAPWWWLAVLLSSPSTVRLLGPQIKVWIPTVLTVHTNSCFTAFNCGSNNWRTQNLPHRNQTKSKLELVLTVGLNCDGQNRKTIQKERDREWPGPAAVHQHLFISFEYQH